MVALALSCALASLAWPLAALALVRAGRVRPDPVERFDAIVVLGARVRPDGTPSAALARRVELGCSLLREGLAPKLVVSGGRVGSEVAEADAAERFIRAGSLAPLDRIVLEREARNTRENAELTRTLIGDAHVLVVTDDWHVARARRLFGRAFSRVAFAGARGRMRGALREVAVFVVTALARPSR